MNGPFGRCFLSVSLSAFSSARGTVPAIIAHQMFPLIQDMGREGGDPIQHREHLNVSREDRVQLSTVADRLGLGMITHFLRGEGGTEGLPGSRAPIGRVRLHND
jgi:hypothetical protein